MSNPLALALKQIDVEALTGAGLTFYGYQSPHSPERYSIVCEDGRGAVELWAETVSADTAAMTGLPTIGGITVHSPEALYPGNMCADDCEILDGHCFTDGSFLTYSRTFRPLIEARESETILAELAEWHRLWFGGAS
ncbi:MAG: hypothetical protein ACRDQG_14105 [Pseudonocardiaceae bacterium]